MRLRDVLREKECFPRLIDQGDNDQKPGCRRASKTTHRCALNFTQAL